MRKVADGSEGMDWSGTIAILVDLLHSTYVLLSQINPLCLSISRYDYLVFDIIGDFAFGLPLSKATKGIDLIAGSRDDASGQGTCRK